MRRKNFLLSGIFFLFACVLVVSCGKDDDDDVPSNIDTAALGGTWKCVDADVESISAGNFELPDMVKDMFINQIESQMEGETITIDPAKVKYDGKVIIFKESGISWKVLSLTSDKMEVLYDTDSSASGYSLKMTIKAEYEKVK